ncbi:MAG: HD domain protein, partial [Lachnospiraceae bacterium]|nr:HD domain protein [Lachnospiraceae bacterium]
MKDWKAYKIILFTIVCVCLNVGGKFLSVWLELPLWADSFGTALCAYIAGPVCGAMVGLTGNLSYCVINRLSAAYSVTNICIGIIIGIAARRKWFDRFYGFMKAASLAMLTALAVSVPINILLDKGYTGNKWGDGVINYLLDKDWPALLCCILGQLSIEFADKVITVATVYLFILIGKWNKRRDSESMMRLGNTKGTAAIMALTLAIGLSFPSSAQADTASDTPDYNDFVQSIYSSNNGLPCGEANDIAQTNDGVLWIGTYAGLYRYNGREFRWIDDYESVKNVNCLFVDEEGRLWIGTNDNGLAIVIREEVVNVLDQSSGLPSNSVRCIAQGSDGYYYVGTTGSMQIIVMNNGLKAVSTLAEINYADSITSDENGHVVTVSSDGRLFLLRNGKIITSIALPGDEELYNCCSFAPDGTLMVGTSTDHIYTFDVSDDTLKQTNVRTCEDVSGINSLDFLDNGTMFVSTDVGISYVDAGGYHVLNTNEFDNSIDNMLNDYQGNLWFCSSRLGLLRLAKSPFKDVYGSVGMERHVVNAIVSWRDCYYIGTDTGLDIVDRACRKEIENDLTAELEG